MTPIQVVGIGLDGAAGLPQRIQQLVIQAAVLAGSDRHLSYFPKHQAIRWPLIDLETRLKKHLQQPQPDPVVVLVSGDPLFFGLGRRLLQHLPADAITFHPHLSSVQLAFSRLKRPWQEADIVSVHGRSLSLLEQCLQKRAPLIAVLTDATHTPAAIARFMEDLALPESYRLWVCENLGGREERIEPLSLKAAQKRRFAPLNVVVLERLQHPLPPPDLPLLGIPDAYFLSFPDRPRLMTKREVRVQILAELALQNRQVVWDIGAGTGSVSVEIARLCPESHIWAIEKSEIGSTLIQQNTERFSVSNVHVVQGHAPQALQELPPPDRVFIGGSSGQLAVILQTCSQRLLPEGCIVVALATLENLSEVTQWLAQHPLWQGRFLHVALTQSATVGSLTRWSPLNPVTLARITQKLDHRMVEPFD